jgi:hypothetical protein
MNDDVVTFGKNHPGLIVKRRRRGLDEVEEAVSSRLDVSAVLNVVGRPKSLRGCVISLVEEGIESFEHDRLIKLKSRFTIRVNSALAAPFTFFDLNGS